MRYLIHGHDKATGQPRSYTIASAMSVEDAIALAQSMGIDVGTVEECATPQPAAPLKASGESAASEERGLEIPEFLEECNAPQDRSAQQSPDIRPATKQKQQPSTVIGIFGIIGLGIANSLPPQTPHRWAVYGLIIPFSMMIGALVSRLFHRDGQH